MLFKKNYLFKINKKIQILNNNIIESKVIIKIKIFKFQMVQI